MRKISLEIGEYYHIFNRGVDKRIIFKDIHDIQRFLKSLRRFNTTISVGSIHFGHSVPESKEEPEKLVEIVAYCLNPNHFHLILTPLVEGGISKFMHKLAMGYTNHFNVKNKRLGCLFQGKFKANHIKTDRYLMYVSAYVNLNFKVHKIDTMDNTDKKVFYKSSWDEYLNIEKGFCNKEIILESFKNIEEYKKEAEAVLKGVLERRAFDFNKDLEN
ncbi:transposase [Patescibacteria group bacterium]|nr:transposase [Patescibacteria group bacterium]